MIKARRRKRLRGEPVQPVEKPKRSECADAIDEFGETLLRHMRADWQADVEQYRERLPENKFLAAQRQSASEKIRFVVSTDPEYRDRLRKK